jgi:hypothetical protein
MGKLYSVPGWPPPTVNVIYHLGSQASHHHTRRRRHTYHTDMTA